ncbi:MAG: hypothetical protein COV75_03210 [Candidatus Omnitrophica bacterium CG11_big_fil_rev_8_21_14_0_20_63_9]|nr:MAG: hypothetical protein COV75_03210 [Candidatus Omnitrophica bacterium CG11_big_fil_rev_8_21_14_0_20_63_9]
MSKERRQHPRIAERISLAVHSESAVVQAETKNLSASGVYCVLDQFLPPMTKLQLDFELPHGSSRKRIRCAGVVVRVEPIIANSDRGRYHIAIFFSDLSDRDRSAVSQYVSQRLAASPSTESPA